MSENNDVTAPAEDTTSPDGDTVLEQISVNGMTCQHCVRSVTEELSAIDGVASVDVDLNPGGASRVTIGSTSRVDPALVQAAIDEAGYSLVGPAS